MVSRVAPGTYTLRLSLEDQVSETEVTLLPNPKINASPQDYAEQQAFLNQIEETIHSMHGAVNQMRSVKTQLKSHKKLLKDMDSAEDLLKLGDSLVKRIEVWEEKLIQPKQKTFQDVINFHNQLNADFMHLKGFADVAEPKITQGAKQRLQDLLSIWRKMENEKNTIVNTEMSNYNSMHDQLQIPALLLKD